MMKEYENIKPETMMKQQEKKLLHTTKITKSVHAVAWKKKKKKFDEKKIENIDEHENVPKI